MTCVTQATVSPFYAALLQSRHAAKSPSADHERPAVTRYAGSPALSPARRCTAINDFIELAQTVGDDVTVRCLAGNSARADDEKQFESCKPLSWN